MDLVDIGVNLTHQSFHKDLDRVLVRAREAGVARMVITGTSERSSCEALALARRYPELLSATAGVHPHEAKSWTDRLLYLLEELAGTPEVVSLGETGLDFHRDFSPRPAQEHVFEAQLELAADLRLPVFLHERQAHGRFMAILSRWRPRLGPAVVHCFTGSEEELAAYLDMDLHVGITGWICDERRGLHLRSLLPRIPAGRLMLETDAPYILPRTIRPNPSGRRNEPAHLVHVLDAVATALNRPREVLADETSTTARRFFNLPPAPA